MHSETGTHTRAHTHTNAWEHAHTHAPTQAHVPGCAQQDADTHRCTHRAHHLLLGSLRDTHSRQGPGEPAQRDGSCPAVPVSWAAAGRPSSRRSDRHTHHCREEALAASRLSSPWRDGAQPCPLGGDTRAWVSPLLPWCLLSGQAALPWGPRPWPALSGWESVTCGHRETAVCVPGCVWHLLGPVGGLSLPVLCVCDSGLAGLGTRGRLCSQHKLSVPLPY